MIEKEQKAAQKKRPRVSRRSGEPGMRCGRAQEQAGPSTGTSSLEDGGQGRGHTDAGPSRPPGAAPGPPRSRLAAWELELPPGREQGPAGPRSGPPPPSARTLLPVLTPPQKPPGLLALPSERSHSDFFPGNCNLFQVWILQLGLVLPGGNPHCWVFRR